MALVLAHIALAEEAHSWQQFFDSVAVGDLNRMKELAASLDLGQGLVEIYTKPWGWARTTALHYSAYMGRKDICKYLIEDVGLDVNLQEQIEILGLGDDVEDPRGETVLNRAILGHHHQTVAYLIRKGANVNLGDLRGFAALHLAACEGLTDTLQLLISSGADIDAISYAGTPLQCAALHGKTETLKILLDNKANPNAMSDYMFSPLLLSVNAKSLECIKLLLEAGVDPNLGGRGVTPLGMAAASEGYNEIIECLLEGRADPDITNHEGITPLEVAVLVHNTDAVKILLPKTSRDPSILDWTSVGIHKALDSEEGRKQREQKRKDTFMEARSKGEEAFEREDYLEAISWYYRANASDPADETVLSKRSLCWALMKNGPHALDDADACIALKPDWAEAHYRKGVACELLEDFAGAEKAYELALNLQPGNEEIQTALENVRDIIRERIIEAL